MKALTPFFSVLSPAGSSGRLTTLIFHRVHAVPDSLFPGEPDAVRFRQILGWLAAWFRVLPLDEAVARLASGSLPARAAAITFDDGYADNLTVACPILREMGMSATFFVATGFLDGGRMWNDGIIEAVRGCPHPELDLSGLGLGVHGLQGLAGRRQAIEAIIGQVKYREVAERLDLVAAVAERSGTALPTDLMMTSAQVRELAGAGMQIGAHTVHHPILARLPEARVETEIATSRDRLAEITGGAISLFAYPNGKPETDYRAEDAATVRRLGFQAAVTTAPGVARRATDPMQIPRFTPWDRANWRFGAKLLANYLVSALPE